MRAYDLTVSGSLVVSGSISNADGTFILSGSTAGASASLSSRLTTAESELGNTLISGSAQIASNISGSLGSNASLIRTLTAAGVSGSFTSVSSSLASRLTSEEGEAEGSVVSSSAQIAADISGSLGSNASLIRTLTAASISGSVTTVSSSLASRITSDSGSLSTRVTTAESELSNTLISGSAQIASNISGSFTAASSSFSTRVTTAESELSNTLISGSAQIASNISGSLGSNASLIRTLTAASISGSYEGGGSTKISGSSTSTGSFGSVEAAGNSRFTNRVTITGPASFGNAITLTNSGGNIVVPATSKYYFDGGYDTYMHESTADTIKFFTGGSEQLKLDANATFAGAVTVGTNLIVAATNRFYLDTGNNTYISEVSADKINFVAGGTSILDITTTSISGSSTSTGSFGRVEASTVTGTLATAAQANITSVGTLSSLTLGGNLDIPEYLRHDGDTDTHIRFAAADSIEITAGAVKMIRFLEDDSQDMVVINEDSADIDFRVESDNDTHALFIQGSDGKIGIGTATPSHKLDVVGDVQIDGTLTAREF